MFGLLPVASRMQREALTIGYRGIEALRPSPLMAAGTRVRGHEFQWSLAGSPPQHLAAYRVIGEERVEGFCDEATVGSYVHLNMAGVPEIARRFVQTCASSRQSTGAGSVG